MPREKLEAVRARWLPLAGGSVHAESSASTIYCTWYPSENSKSYHVLFIQYCDFDDDDDDER